MCSRLLISDGEGSLSSLCLIFHQSWFVKGCLGDVEDSLILNATSIKTSVLHSGEANYLEAPLRKLTFHTKWIVGLNVKGLSKIFCKHLSCPEKSS